MTSVEKNSARTGFIVLALFCIAFIFCCIFIKQPQKVIYKTIQIQLTSTPVKKAEQPKAQTKQPSRQSQQKQSQPKQEKTAVQKNQKSESQSSGPKIKKSVEELMAEQNAPKTKKTEWDDSLFDDVPEVQTDRGSVKRASSSSSISGTAATVSKSSSSASASSSSANTSSSSAASASTAQALQNMSDTVYSMTVADGIKSRTDIISDSSSGKVTIRMSDGRARQLISPSKPTLDIDEDNARLVDTSRTVTISFTVTAEGTVPLNEIVISPASVLPTEIQREIKEQIAMWKFTSDPSGAKGTASFKYTLEIK